MAYWQVAAGDGQRDYSEIFLKNGVMLIGPGDPGDYFKNKEYYTDVYRPSDVSGFAELVKEGDIVVLKRPSGMRGHSILQQFSLYISTFARKRR